MEKAAPLLEPCPSEGSSTSPAAPEGDELNKLKEKVVEAPEAESDECKKHKEKVVCEKSSGSEKPLVSPTRGILDLKLPSDQEEKCEDDNFEMSPVNESNDMGESSIKAEKENDGRVFTCSYCKRKFNSSQALGGHQNAHRQARALAKEQHHGVMPPFGHPPPSNYSPYYPHDYSSCPQEPSMYGTSSTCNRSLGVRADSMIHKPSPKHPWSTSTGLAMGYRFRQHANPWSTHDASFVDRLKMQLASQIHNNNNNNNSNNNNNHSFAMAAPSTFQGSGNREWNFLGVPPNYNNLNLALNNGNGSAGNRSLQAAAFNGHKNSNQQPDESSSDLDLDLKL